MLCSSLIAALALAGCGGDTDTATETSPGSTAGVSGVAVTAWFADGAGRLVPEVREAPAGTDPLTGALDALAAGPADPALLPALPAGTRVLSATVDGAVATVDLSAAFEDGYPSGGSAAELAVTAPLVRTAAEASGAARVRVLVEGRVPTPTGSQLDFSVPFAPGDLPAP